jgi:hypothetical protein
MKNVSGDTTQCLLAEISNFGPPGHDTGLLKVYKGSCSVVYRKISLMLHSCCSLNCAVKSNHKFFAIGNIEKQWTKLFSCECLCK